MITEGNCNFTWIIFLKWRSKLCRRLEPKDKLCEHKINQWQIIMYQSLGPKSIHEKNIQKWKMAYSETCCEQKLKTVQWHSLKVCQRESGPFLFKSELLLFSSKTLVEKLHIFSEQCFGLNSNVSMLIMTMLRCMMQIMCNVYHYTSFELQFSMLECSGWLN